MIIKMMKISMMIKKKDVKLKKKARILQSTIIGLTPEIFAAGI